MHLIQSSVAVALLCLAGWAAAQGFADSRGLAPPPRVPTIGPDRAAAIAREQTGGRVLDVRPLPNGERASFAVRLLLDAGRVRTVVVDGQSGQLR